MLGLKWWAFVVSVSEVVLTLGLIALESVVGPVFEWCLDFDCSLFLIENNTEVVWCS